MSLDSVFKLSVIVNMIDQLTGPMGRVNSTVSGSVSKLDQLNQSFSDMTQSGMGIAAMGTGMVAAALAPVQATFETKRALGVLKSMGVENFKALEDAARSFSDTWAGTTKAEFLRAATDIKGGIDSLTDEGVAQYTEIAGITAKATSATIDEMTSLFATGYGIYKDYYNDLSDLQFAEMLSAGLADSIRVFKASGKSMADSISVLGAAATSAQVPLEEQLTVLGMLQATMTGSEAGTKYRAFLQAAARAGKELGLKFTDANNQLLSMPQILELMRGKFGETVDAAEKMQIQKAFGTDEAVALVDLLYNKTDNLQKNILTIYNSMGKGTAIAKEMANAINKTEPEQYELLKQRLHNVTAQIGNQLLPAFNAFMAKSAEWLSQISGWISGHQELVKVLMLVLIAIGSVLIVAGVLMTTFGAVGVVVTKSIGVFRTLFTAVKAIPDLFLTVRIMAMYAGDAVKAGFNNMVIGARMAIISLKNVALGMANMARQAMLTAVRAMPILLANLKNVALGLANMARQAMLTAVRAMSVLLANLKNVALGLANMAKQAMLTAVRAMPGLIASVWSFTVALLANPVTWIVVGIIALVAAIILLWQNWDAAVVWIQGVWSGFVSGIQAGFDWIRNLFAGMPLWLQIAIAAFMPFIGIPMLIITHWDSIVAFFSNMWTRIKDGVVNGINAIKEFFMGVPAFFRESGAKIIDTLVEGIKSVSMKPVEAVKSIFQKVRNLLPFSDAKEGPFSELTLSGRRVLETIGDGMAQRLNVPAEMTERAFSKVQLLPEIGALDAQGPNAMDVLAQDSSQLDLSGSQDVKKINLREIVKERSETTTTTKETDSGTTIEKLELSIDITKLKDLQTLFKLVKEIEDHVNANGATPSPAS